MPLNAPAHVRARTLTPLQPVHLTEFGVPGADLGGIHYLRNVVDAEGLVAAAAAAKDAGGQVRQASDNTAHAARPGPCKAPRTHACMHITVSCERPPVSTQHKCRQHYT